jgi:Sigma-70, region 4
LPILHAAPPAGPADQLPETLKLEHVIGDFDPRFTESLIGVYPALSEEIISADDPKFLLEGGIDAREQIFHIIGALSKKEKDVLFRRFGLQGYRTKTLEEIGKEFYVTRERVRQLEAQAIRRLQVGTRIAAFKKLLDLESNTLWEILSRESELLLPEDLEQRHREIDPILQLAIAVVFGDLGKWVSTSGTQFGAGWIRTERPLDALRSMIAAVRDYLRNLTLPRSVAGIAESLDIAKEDVALAVRVSDKLQVFEDYVVGDIVGPQARRTGAPA